MKNFLLATAGVFALLSSVPAHATIIDHGVTYTLESQATADPLTQRFALVISGENTATDTEGHRTGITGFALNEVNNGATASGSMVFTASLATGVILAPNTGWTFVDGNVNQGGCTSDPSPNFFCFDNSAVPPTPSSPANDLAGPLVYVFDVTLDPGNSWAGYNPAFRIDWVGANQNYSFVSTVIGVNPTCPDCTPTPTDVEPVPEPASIALLGTALMGMGVFLRSRKRRLMRGMSAGTPIAA